MSFCVMWGYFSPLLASRGAKGIKARVAEPTSWNRYEPGLNFELHFISKSLSQFFQLLQPLSWMIFSFSVQLVGITIGLLWKYKRWKSHNIRVVHWNPFLTRFYVSTPLASQVMRKHVWHSYGMESPVLRTQVRVPHKLGQILHSNKLELLRQTWALSMF